MKFSISRSIVIDAGIAEVRPHLADFSRWSAWSPWSVIEPDHESGMQGAMTEVGSSMSWDGKVIGSGNISLIEQSDTRLDYDLVFVAPWKSQAKTSFVLEPASILEPASHSPVSISESGASASNGATKVTWVMHSDMPFFLFFMIGMVKAMVGMDYDRGLLMLKSIVETGGVDADTTDEGVVDFGGFSYVGLARTSYMNDLPADMEVDFERVMQACIETECEPEHTLSIYNKVKLTKELFSYVSAVSVGDVGAVKQNLLSSLENASGSVLSGQIKAQKMLHIKHRGSYQYLGNAWAMGHLTLRAKKIKQNGAPFEYYHNDPAETAESDLLTSVYFPIKG